MTCASLMLNLQSTGKRMSSTATQALITPSWIHITSVDTTLRQTSCLGRELWIFSANIWSMRLLNAPSHREGFSKKYRTPSRGRNWIERWHQRALRVFTQLASGTTAARERQKALTS